MTKTQTQIDDTELVVRALKHQSYLRPEELRAFAAMYRALAQDSRATLTPRQREWLERVIAKHERQAPSRLQKLIADLMGAGEKS